MNRLSRDIKKLLMIPISNWMHTRLVNEGISINSSLIYHAVLESEMSDLCGLGGSWADISKKVLIFFET
jgi:hypothetical protein